MCEREKDRERKRERGQQKKIVRGGIGSIGHRKERKKEDREKEKRGRWQMREGGERKQVE